VPHWEVTAAERALKHLDVSVVSDALDRLGIEGQVPYLRAVSGTTRVYGPAYTVLYAPCTPEQSGTVGDYIDDVPAGAVVVIDNQGCDDATVWGGILSTVAIRKEIAGTVINGVCRDVLTARQTSYPLFALRAWMRTGKDRVRMESVQVPVRLAGVDVYPGDIIVGDLDGVVVVPAARVTEVADVALAVSSAEVRVLSRIEAGSRLDAARQEEGYHLLQRRQIQ
jgi:4-hydroxy-4-methyl-2-oxoglutarate aldolase